MTRAHAWLLQAQHSQQVLNGAKGGVLKKEFSAVGFCEWHRIQTSIPWAVQVRGRWDHITAQPAASQARTFLFQSLGHQIFPSAPEAAWRRLGWVSW